MPIKDYDKGPLGINSIVEKLDQTGTAYERDVGESSGNVMEVGAFGLGSKDLLTQQSLDLNALSTLGWNYIAGPVNGRVSTTSFIFTLPSLAGSGRTRQWQYPVLGDTVYYRYQNAGVWQPWIKSYDEANILGPVSQSNGVPTGAIIERGSNANGEYVKYADGTLIQRGFIDIPALSTSEQIGAFYRNTSSDANTDLPVSFNVSSYDVEVSSGKLLPTAPDNLGVFYSFARNTAQFTFYVLRETNSTEGFSGKFLAIGRWY